MKKKLLTTIFYTAIILNIYGFIVSAETLLIITTINIFGLAILIKLEDIK
jgi:hypothetical protein